MRCTSLLLVFALAACAPPPPSHVPEVQISTAPEEARAPARAAIVAGSWSETWGVGGETDVAYHDVYEIKGSGTALAIACPARPNYVFQKISLEGDRLVVQIENRGLVIDYDLRLHPSGTKLVGRAKTSKGTDVPIVWDRTGAPGP
jgi:hypothetical protein